MVPSIVIVGGGASGTLCAIRLLDTLKGSAKISIIESKPELGTGIAYGTKFESHLLNVRAIGMTAHPEDPEHFVHWLAERRGETSEAAHPMFAQRKEYAAYLAEELRLSQALSSEIALQHIEDRAVSVQCSGGGYEVGLQSGSRLQATHLVLAMGNRSPKLPPVLRDIADPRVIVDPWGTEGLSSIASHHRVLLVGAGLTMIDTVLLLREMGHFAKIDAVSRHGLMPAVHTRAKANAPFDPSAESVRVVFKNIIRAARAQVESGGDWRSVIDSVRPHVQTTWVRLPLEEKRRFMRHLQTLWDVHRHRVAPPVWEEIAALQAAGTLSVCSGRIFSVKPWDAGLEVSFVNRSGKVSEVFVDRIVNCTGPNPDWSNIGDPLLSTLIEAGLAKYDELGQGICVNRSCSVVNPNGSVSETLYAIGPLCRGTLWETTAIPEIRGQANLISTSIAQVERVLA
ncbi:MAG: FAD/NAD(P)-binding protein [Fimbriimonas sp.]